MPGTTLIYRNGSGYVTRVSAPESDTYLFFNTAGQASRVVSVMGSEVTDEFLDYTMNSTGDMILSSIRKYIKDIQAIDIQQLIGGGTIDPVLQSSWTLPYNAPATPITPAPPGGFTVTVDTSAKPSFAWNPITDRNVVGVMIYVAINAPSPQWKNWTYVIPVPATSFTSTFRLNPGNYTFAITTINNDGIQSAFSQAANLITVV